MEPFRRLLYMLEPAPLMLIGTAIFVTFASAYRALDHEKEMERNLDFLEASITIDHFQALIIPIIGSCTLVLMFYLFSSVSQLITAFVAISSGSALYFCLSPYVSYFISKPGLVDIPVSRSCHKSITTSYGTWLFCILIVSAWLITGHWLLNNLFGVCICIAFVSHVRLPNIKICTLLFVCLFLYDIFWVFFSERFFGENVMVSVTIQSASNPFHKMAEMLSLPGLEMITQKLEMPVKLIYPRNFTGKFVPGSHSRECLMLGLGDVAIPGMLIALVLCFDDRKSRSKTEPTELSLWKRYSYAWYALAGYSTGVIIALAIGILTQSPQPALLYLVPCTLGPVILLSWARNELWELWDGANPISSEKTRGMEV